MELSRFEQLVSRLEVNAAREPGSYKFKVWLLAMLGYAYLVLILALLAGIVGLLAFAMLTGHGNVVFVKLGIPLLVLIGAMLKAMWFRIPKPEGTAIHRKQAPKLFALLDDMQKQLGGVRVHEVVMTDQFTAAVTQIPQLGVLGWHRNYLILGLPLLEALSEQQFKAVLAHELGHLSGRHGRFGSWIYRVRRTWGQIMAELEKKKSAVLFKSFLNWYGPFFNAYTFTLARANEYEADRWSAKLTDKKTAADALVAVHVIGGYMSASFWPSVYKKADQTPVPVQAFHELQSALSAGVDPADAEALLRKELSRETGLDDTHPSLKDRLAALGESPAAPAPVARSAMEAYLPEARSELVSRFEAEWQKGISEAWRKRHNEMQLKRSRLEKLSAKPEETLTDEELWGKAELTENTGELTEARRLYNRLLERQPAHAQVLFALGRVMLEEEQEEGVRYLNRSMETDADATGAACNLIIGYLLRNDRRKEAEEYWSRGVEWQRRKEQAEEERSLIRYTDTFLPHGLDAAEWEDLKRQVSQYPNIKSACLVQKKLAYYPEKPLYVMLITLKGISDAKSQAYVQQVINELQTSLPLVLVNVGKMTKFKPVMKRHPEGRLV